LAYTNRGSGWRDKGEYDRAIADYNDAIRLDPQFVQAYVNRGRTWSNKADYDRALADYNEAIRLSPQDARAYLNRGVTRFAQGQFESAQADVSAAVRLNPNDAYSVIWRYFAQARADHKSAAASELATNATKVDRQKWPAPIIDLLAGMTDVHGVLEVASSDPKKEREQMCVAAFFVGEWYLLQGQRTEARTSLERAERECPKSFLQYFSAAAELKRLAQQVER
jgi:lipoprotein NlpI